jgi:putative membrane protein
MTRRLRIPLVAAVAALAAPSTALAHGGQVPRSELAGAWRASWVVLALAALGAVLFAQAIVRLRRRGRRDDAGWDRVALFSAGLGLLVLALVSPLDALGEDYLLSGHMLQHMLIGDAAPALLVVAVRSPLVFFLLPAFLLRRLAHVGALRRALGFLLRPSVSMAVWVLVYAAWHAPAAYDYVLTRPLVHDLEHATFVFAGLLVWAQIVDPARRAALSRYGRLAFAVALFAGGQVLADVLIFSFTPLYPAYVDQPERLFGLSPRLDQQLAGVVMMVEQLLTVGAAAVLLLRPAFQRRRSVERRLAAPSV